MTKNHLKALVFTTLGILQLKKLMIVTAFTVQILCFDHPSGYIEKEHAIKYLVFDSTDEYKELIKKWNDVWKGINSKIKEISGERDYKKDYMKIEFNSDDDLPLEKPLKFHNMTITIKSVVDDGKLYPQIYLDDALYELNV